MSLTLLFGLALQLTALILVMRQVRSRFLMFNGAILVIMLCVFHGLTELANIFYPASDRNRVLVDQESVDRWVLLAGSAILLFSLAYIWTLKRSGQAQLQNLVQTIPPVSLPVLIAMAVPSLFLAATGGKYSLASGTDRYTAYGYWIGGLTQELFLLLIVMCFVALILHSPVRWTLLLLATEMVLVTIVGSRLYVIAAFAMTAGALSRYGRSLKSKHVFIGALLLAILSAVVSSSRVYYGRENYHAPVGERILNIARSGVTALSDSELSITDDFVYRFDGNIFPALVNEKFREGYPQVGLRSFANNFLLYIPSFIYRNKLDSTLEDRDERAYTQAHFGMRFDNDLATTLLTVLFGYYGTPGLMCFAAGLGIIFANIDKWLNSTNSTFSFVTGVGLTYCCILTEQGVSVYFQTFRASLAIVFVMLAASRLHFRASQSQTSRSSTVIARARLSRPMIDRVADEGNLSTDPR